MTCLHVDCRFSEHCKYSTWCVGLIQTSHPHQLLFKPVILIDSLKSHCFLPWYRWKLFTLCSTTLTLTQGQDAHLPFLQLWKNYSFHQLLFSVYSYANLIYDHHKVSLSVSVILKKVLLDLYVTDPCRYFLHRYFFFIVVYYQIATFIWL